MPMPLPLPQNPPTPCGPSRAAPMAFALGLTLLLGGCAGTWRVDSQVQSFAHWGQGSAPPQAPQAFRFERLPSQREGEFATRQDSLESMVRETLAPLGWTLAPTPSGATWTVQVGATGVQLPRAPWDEPRPLFWPGFGLGLGHHGGVSASFMWGAGFWPPEFPYYQRRVSVVVRKVASGQVVYETQAAHDGRWSGTPELWRAMVVAALKDFPAPPVGLRQVDIDLPR